MLMKKENQLILELCRFKNFNKDKVKDLLENGFIDLPYVLGHLLYNRAGGTAYDLLRKNNLLKSTNREFANSLKNCYESNITRNISYMQVLKELTASLKPLNTEYAFLKGAYLCNIYPKGHRVSNDYDILTTPFNISELTEILSDDGYRQGYIRNNEFIAATREEIITSRMMRGETVPFVKEVNLPFMKFAEVDINFSLNYKNEQSLTVDRMLQETVQARIGDFKIPVLSPEDFMLHLCSHLYKEATTYQWVRMGRDLSIYKFLDIYMLLDNFDKNDFINLKDRLAIIQNYNECFYSLFYTNHLLRIENGNYGNFISEIKPGDENVMHKVIDPATGKTFVFKDKNYINRLFNPQRRFDLEEEK